MSPGSGKMLVSLDNSHLVGSTPNSETGEGCGRRRLNVNPEVSAMAEQTTILVQVLVNTKAANVCVCLGSGRSQKMQDCEERRKRALGSVQVWTVWFI